MPTTHVHHIHHYTGSSSSSSSSTSSSQEPVFYDYRNSSLSSTPSVKEPIIYDYNPQTSKNESFSSDEDVTSFATTNPNDLFIAGVENMLFYGGMKNNQHQVLFVTQGSDGISFEDEVLTSINRFEMENTNMQYFPDVEFRFDADDEPNDDDLQNIYNMYKDLVDYGRC